MNFRRFQMFTYAFLLVFFVSADCVTDRGRSRERNWPLIIKEAAEGHLYKVKDLLNSGVNINTVNNMGWSALMMAISNENSEVAKYLIKEDANLNIKSRRGGFTALKIAIRMRDNEVISLIREKMNNQSLIGRLDELSIVDEAAEGHLLNVKALLNNGADIDSTNHAGWSVLMIAISNGHEEVAKYLIEKGADLSITSIRGGFTALSLAKRMGNYFIESLINRKLFR